MCVRRAHLHPDVRVRRLYCPSLNGPAAAAAATRATLPRPAAVAAAARRSDPLQAEEGGEEAHRFVRMAAMLSQRFTAVIIFHGKDA